MKKTLNDILSLCRSEEEIKHKFSNFFDLEIDSRDYIDLYTEEILYEFKFETKLSNIQIRSRAIAQGIYYIRKLKYGKDTRKLCSVICIVDKDEAVLVEVEQLKCFFLKTLEPGYDWDLAASNPDKRLVEDLSKSDVICSLYVYKFDVSESLSEFIRKLEIYQRGEQLSLFGNKKEISEYNFYPIYERWQDIFSGYVENGRKCSEYFVTDIESGRSTVIDNAQILFSMNSGEKVIKYLPMSEYTHFWSVYDKITDLNQVAAIRQKMDRMTNPNMRRFTGEFYTPLNYAEKAIDYIGRVVGHNWYKTGKYRLWDMAAGSGNLEYLLPAEALKYCFLSSSLDDDVKYCKKVYPDATVFQYDYLNDDVNILIHPTLLNMGVTFSLPDNLVEDMKNPDIKWILFFNPPYVTSNNNERDKSVINKDNVSMTAIQRVMTDNNLGEVSRELSSQFLYRISVEFSGKDALISVFSKIKYLNANNDQKLRDTFFKYKYERGFIFSSKAFSDSKASFPVGFLIWRMNKETLLKDQELIVDVYEEKNGELEKVGIKQVKAEDRDKLLNKWIQREAPVDIMPPFSSAITLNVKNKDKRDRVSAGFIASLMCKGNELANQNNTAIYSSPYVSAGALSVTPQNFEKAMIIHVVRRLPKAIWLNDRDQFRQPSADVFEDEEFISDCVLWSLFSNSNQTASIDKVVYLGKSYRIRNHLYPFLVDEIKKWEINNADMKANIWARHSDRFAALWLSTHRISAEGRNLIACARDVYMFFYKHYNNLAWPKFDIRNWDAGWWQIRKALNDVGIGQDILERLETKHKVLGSKIMLSLIKYEFIEPAFIDVNN